MGENSFIQSKLVSYRYRMLFFVILAFALGRCQAFLQTPQSTRLANIRSDQHVHHVALPAIPEAPKKPRTGPPRTRFSRNNRRAVVRDESRWRQAQKVEQRMSKTLEVMQNVMNGKRPKSPPLFPSVRECNAALATFGDGGDFLRALRLFVKMRKAASLANQCRTQKLMVWHVPAPTLVTYSTLMSRAVHVGRPGVALRLWNLMKLQNEFWSNRKLNDSKSATTVLVPDVKAANILMNAYAKLANVEDAFDLMRQMQHGNGTDVPAMTPNLVTYNTLVDACHKAGELDAALQAKQQLDESGLVPDARTYTSLIATVARKTSQTSGANDPSLAFSFLHEMKSRNVRPNGMTYSALIDVCGRCRRPDLALQGLRMMLRQKASEGDDVMSLPNEVGAWTAAINACGKSGRIQTARRLFWFMRNFGVQPNAITCGCLTDCLLRNGRTADCLDVLRYMKRKGIVPSEVMYTSLMTHAGKLVEIENQKPALLEETADDSTAIEVYTELMTSLMQGNTGGKRNRRSHDKDSLLVKVFLVFQEMKTVGATPDLACYNALLRACARAGDVNRARDVLRRLQEDGLEPNDTTWREMIRAAGNAGRVDLAEATWSTALEYRGEGDDPDNPVLWRPTVESFGALAWAYLRHASRENNDEERKEMYRRIIAMYRDVMVGKEDRRLHLVGREVLQENPGIMMFVLQAIVNFAELSRDNDRNHQVLRNLAISISSLDCLAENSHEQNRAASRALRIAQSWSSSSSQARP